MGAAELNVLLTSDDAKVYITNLITSTIRKSLKPPPKLNLVEWADTYRYLPDNSAESGRWKTSRVEVARQPMLSVSDKNTQEITVMCCIQLMKHLSVDTPILTTRGWKTMGNMKQGDKVYGSDGKPCNVLAVSETTTQEPCYRMTFSDGAEIVCSESHNWVVDDSENRSKTIKYGVTKSTGEIANSFKNDYGNRYAIPVAKPIVNRKKDLPIEPYMLGVWLGDGHSYSTRFTSHIDDLEIKIELENKGWLITEKTRSNSSSANTVEYHFTNGSHLHSQMSKLGLMKGGNKNQQGNEKHIPDIYFRASKSQRLELMQGLMDTDGTISKDGATNFTTSSIRLRDDFMKLCWTLGLKPTYKTVKTTRKDSYQVHFSSYSDLPVFKLKRKLERIRDINNPNLRVSESKRRRIINVEKIENTPVRCIAVDSSDHLYLCGRELIPTHNTELMINAALFYMHQEPSPLMYIAPKKETAEAWSKERLVKSVNSTPVVSDIFTENRRGEGNTITQKQFAGGQLSIVSARNPTDLAMRAVRVLLFDETDKYPNNVGSGEGGSGGEGDPIAVAWGRSTTYGKRAKKIMACSPTVAGKSRIEEEYHKSNMSVFYQPCPHCDHAKTLTWMDVNIPKDPKTGDFIHSKAAICCSECGAEWTESDRHKSIKNGYWVATKPEVTWHHGYKVSALASPFTPVTVLAKEFADAQGNLESLKAFYNTRMAETWREAGEQPDWERIYERREDYKIGEIPDGALLITCGIDVQKDYLIYEVTGWGRRKESWSIDYGVIEGGIEDEETKQRLTEFLDRTFKNSAGVEVPIMKTCIDSGYQTQEVYAFCRTYGSDRVVPVKGEKDENLQTIIGTPRPVDVLVDGKRHSRGIMLWQVGGSVIKEQIYRWLVGKKPTDEELNEGKKFPTGYSHFPMYDEEFFKQLTAEQHVTTTNKYGFSESKWEKLRKDNHLLDCRVYSRAASAMLQIDRMNEDDWLNLENIYLNTPIIEEKSEKPQKSDRKRNIRKSNWIKRR